MNITKIKKNDIFLATVPIGSLPLAQAQTYIKDIELKFRKHFSNIIMVIPTREISEYKIEILRQEK